MSYSESVNDISRHMKDSIDIDATGNVHFADNAFERTLQGTDLTMDMFKVTQEHRDNVIAGTALALGEKGMEFLSKNPNINAVSGEFKVNRDSIGGVVHRTRQFPDGQGGMKENKGALSMKYVANGQSGNRGQLKKVKQHLAELAKELL